MNAGRMVPMRLKTWKIAVSTARMMMPGTSEAKASESDAGTDGGSEMRPTLCSRMAW